jgi:hypothetical protein
MDVVDLMQGFVGRAERMRAEMHSAFSFDTARYSTVAWQRMNVVAQVQANAGRVRFRLNGVLCDGRQHAEIFAYVVWLD